MRTVKVEVPVDVMLEFAEKLSSTDFEHQITGTTEDDEVEIEIFYEKHESDAIDELEEYLQELIDNIEEEEED